MKIFHEAGLVRKFAVSTFVAAVVILLVQSLWLNPVPEGHLPGNLAAIVALSAVLTGIVLLVFRQIVMARIVRLANFAHRIGQGDFDARLQDSSPDEVGQLSRILNAMANNLAVARSNLERKIEAQREVDQFKDNFLAMVSHELRTPLTAVIGFSDAILEGYTGAITEDQRRLLKKILENGENLKQMLDNILDYEKIQSGRAEAVPWMASLEEIIDYSLSLAMFQAEQKDVKIVRTIPFKLPPVRVDVMQVQSVITNLLTNAVKFTHSGGKIEILGHVLPVIGGGPSLIEILVSDTGIGIPREERNKIFFRFYRVPQAGTREYPGAGLGLALARELALAHGGWLQVRDREGWATTFSFGIPADGGLSPDLIRVQRTSIHLPTMINGIIHMLEQEQGRDLGIAFPLPAYGTPDQCLADRAYLRAILINIIQNSLRYRRKDSLIRVSLVPGKEAVEIVIDNQGPAFSQSELDRVFDESGDAPVPDRQPRFMSLRSARKILSALDGWLKIENIKETGRAEGEGAVRFTIHLPRPQTAERRGADVQEEDSRHRG